LDWTSTAQRDFIKSYLFAEIHNILSALGGQKIDIYTDTHHKKITGLLAEINRVFGTDLSRRDRPGYGRSINVIERMLDSLNAGDAPGGSDAPNRGKKYSIAVHDLKDMPSVPPAQKKTVNFTGSYREAFTGIDEKVLLGMDVGGTDIKLAVSYKGKLCFLTEYDWFPALFTRSQQLIDPIVRLTREAAEWAARENGGRFSGFDGIGLSFPDVVLRNKIAGGEVYKTRGIRNNPAVEYEAEYHKLTDLDTLLAPYCSPSGTVGIINDGHMAAWTAAIELIAEGKPELLAQGRFAHTLGTELGTGWIDECGAIPEIPLEVYNFIIDLGSFAAARYPGDDLRSSNNFNTGLSGTLQKITAQNGVFRLAIKAFLAKNRKQYDALIQNGFISDSNGEILVNLEPKDMRKPLLEHLMRLAENGDPDMEEVFIEIGRSLGITCRETGRILSPACADRVLYGRLVKMPHCFELIQRGAAEIDGTIRLSVADEQSAFSPLMKQLKDDPRWTVAQFAQSVGALYFSNYKEAD
jgi:hypothetical protein